MDEVLETTESLAIEIGKAVLITAAVSMTAVAIQFGTLYGLAKWAEKKENEKKPPKLRVCR